MSAGAGRFDRLLYTDCASGTGRGAGGGFQVQAQSPGVDSGLSKLAVGSLLYEVQVPWLNQRLPVGEFPLGFAHACGVGYATGQSRYLGKELSGPRHGNHLDDCLLTKNGDLYGAIRPAQLWRARLWRDEPWPGKECPPLDPSEIEAGPLTVEAVADWARERPERGPVLARLLSVLEDPRGKRVVIVSDGADEAMTWIAAATLLLPARHALGVSFKVFSSVPLQAGHRITAAPATLFPQIHPGTTGSAFVLDARTCAADEVAVSERAAFFTGHFTGNGDPYDVVDAAELADALGGQAADGLGNRDTMLTAWALTRPDDQLPEPTALEEWLTTAPQDLLDEHGAAVAARILQAAPSVRALRWIDRAVADKRLAADPAVSRVQLFAAELAEARAGQHPMPPAEVLPGVPLGASAARDAESELSSALVLGDDRQADLLLCLARRHGILPDIAQPPVRQRLMTFAASWLDRQAGYHLDGWALRAEVLDCAHDELHRRLAMNGVESVAPVIKRLNRYFGDRADLSDPLDRHIQASLIGAEPKPQRAGRLRALLAAAGALRDPAAAADAATALQHALIQWRAVSGDVAVTVLTGLPSSLPVESLIADRAAQELAHMSQRPTRELLDLLAGLERQGRAPASGKLADLLAADRQVGSFIVRAADDRVRTDQRYLDDTIKVLQRADQGVVAARIDEVLAACLSAKHPQLGAFILARLRSPLPRLLVERWTATLGTRDLVGDGLWYVACIDYEDLPGKRAEQLTAAVREYGQALPESSFDVWYHEVARQLGPTKRDLWERALPTEPDTVRGGSRLGPRLVLWRPKDGGRP